MPIYEYVCQGCGHRFEVRQSFKDPPLTACERCGQAVTKVISPPAIMFKGSGWYVTDYSDKLKEKKTTEPAGNGKSDSKSETPAASAPAASGSDGGAKTESKPATPAGSSTPSSSTPSTPKTSS